MRGMMDTCRLQVAQGRFFVHAYSGKLFRNAEFCGKKSILVSYVDGWRTFITKCEEIHNNLSKLNCWSHAAEKCIVAVLLGLRQALTRIGCLQEFESGPTVGEPCPAGVPDYGRVYYDSVTSASLPSKLCEEAMQLENQVHEGDECVHTLRAWSRERARTHSDWDSLGLYEQGRYRASFHPGKIGCSGDEENDEYGFDGHVYDICCDPTC